MRRQLVRNMLRFEVTSSDLRLTMVVVGRVVAKLRNVVVAVLAVVCTTVLNVDVITGAVVIAAAVVVITSGTATWLPNTVFALRKLCIRMLSAICTKAA